MNIFKKSKEQVEENKSEDLKIENQENKRETTSEKNGVVSLQFSEEMSDKRIHAIITVAGVAIALFLITLMMHTIVSKVVYPNFSMANEINEVQFLWGTSNNDLDREDAVWKQATDENKIQKVMSVTLFITGIFMILGVLNLIQGGGDNIGLTGEKLIIGAIGNFILGLLITARMGLYAPCMAPCYFLGLSPTVDFPIIMGSCAT